VAHPFAEVERFSKFAANEIFVPYPSRALCERVGQFGTLARYNPPVAERRMKSLLCLTFLLANSLVFSQTTDHPDGEIKGVVINQSGDAVPGATVYIVPQNISFDDVSPRSVQSDKEGEFDLHGGLKLGAYKIYSRKEADAYPDRSDAFYADSSIEPPKVELTDDKPFASVTVTMGEKASVLTGRIVDADTGTPMKANLVFIDPDGNHHSILADGKYRVLLPVGEDISVMLMPMSPEYRTETIPPLRLDPGQQKHLNIPLHKN
jgi:hypothetical protein